MEEAPADHRKRLERRDNPTPSVKAAAAEPASPPRHAQPPGTGPALNWAPYTSPGGAAGVAIYDADGNILAGFHKQSGGGVLRRYNGGGTLPDMSREVTSQVTVPRQKASSAYWLGTRVRPVSPAERRAVAAYIKTGEIAERVPLEKIEQLHIPFDETRDMLSTVLSTCNLMVCYVTQAELRRHGLI